MPGTQADSSLSYTFIEMPICEDGYMFNKKMTVTFENSAPWLWEVPVLVILHFLMEIWALFAVYIYFSYFMFCQIFMKEGRR